MPIAPRLRKAGYRMLGFVTEQSLVGSFKKKNPMFISDVILMKFH